MISKDVLDWAEKEISAVQEQLESGQPIKSTPYKEFRRRVKGRYVNTNDWFTCEPPNARTET